MSLFDPNSDLERLERDFTGVWSNGSGKPIPEVPETDARSLQIQLLRIGVKIIRSPDEGSNWEEAYSAFATAILKGGVVATEELLHIDIPNMLFNHALVSGWFRRLTLLRGDSSEVLLFSPQRVPKENIGASEGEPYTDDAKEQQFRWYRDRIRPAVYEWTANAIVRQFKYEDFVAEVSEMAGREPPESNPADAQAILGKDRGELLQAYKSRLTDPETGKPYSDQRLYTSKGHSMHKPEFFQWKKGKLRPSHPASESFERFLKGNAHPNPRPATKS